MISAEIAEKIKPGAKIKVWERIKESGKERQGSFSGLVLARKHGSEPGATFTVRATVAGVGVEKIYPLHSPMIAKITVLSSPKKVSRAKLYYVRHLSPKKLKEKMRG